MKFSFQCGVAGLSLLLVGLSEVSSQESTFCKICGVDSIDAVVLKQDAPIVIDKTNNITMTCSEALSAGLDGSLGDCSSVQEAAKEACGCTERYPFVICNICSSDDSDVSFPENLDAILEVDGESTTCQQAYERGTSFYGGIEDCTAARIAAKIDNVCGCFTYHETCNICGDGLVDPLVKHTDSNIVIDGTSKTCEEAYWDGQLGVISDCPSAQAAAATTCGCFEKHDECKICGDEFAQTTMEHQDAKITVDGVRTGCWEAGWEGEQGLIADCAAAQAAASDSCGCKESFASCDICGDIFSYPGGNRTSVGSS